MKDTKVIYNEIERIKENIQKYQEKSCGPVDESLDFLTDTLDVLKDVMESVEDAFDDRDT